MKKILALIMVLTITAAFSACSDKEAVKDTKDESSVVENSEAGEKTEDVSDNEQEEEGADADNPKEEESKDEEPSSEENKTDKAPVTEEKPQEKPETKPEEAPKEEPQEKPQETPQEKPQEEGKKSVGNALLDEFKNIASDKSALSVIQSLSESSVVSALSLVTAEVEPGFLTGFDNAEISGFSEGAMLSPMIGTVPFVGYVFTLEDGTNASEFISNLKASANLRWNICTSADEMVAGQSGNKVFFVMAPESFEE